MTKNSFIVVIFFCFKLNLIYSQNNELGSWNIINAKYNLSDKLSIFGEAQLRSLKFYHHFHYYEYKFAFNYKVYNNFKISLGSGSYQTYKEGGDFVLPKNNNEFRIWPQIILYQSINKIKIEQRYRSELRWTSIGYKNRFRYRIAVSYPFGKEKNNYKPYQLSLSNELFFTNKEPYFERNRINLLLNYKPSTNISLQLGYLHQFDYKINDETGRDFLVVGVYFDFYRKLTIKKDNNTEINDN